MLPPFNEYGLLPGGIHDCTIEEAEVRFGRFQQSDRRPQLWAHFREFFREVQAASFIAAILLNGSFVTARPDPNDIDLILVVAPTHETHDIRGLFLCDGSAVPSSLAVNPQLTIMALATRAAEFIARSAEG